MSDYQSVIPFNDAVETWVINYLSKKYGDDAKTAVNWDDFQLKPGSFTYTAAHSYQMSELTWDYEYEHIIFKWRDGTPGQWKTEYLNIELGQLIRELTE